MTTDTSEKGLEALIAQSLVSAAGYVQGRSEEYDRDHALDLAFLTATQPKAVEALELAVDELRRTQFLLRWMPNVGRRA